jgi:hypothetical protein
MAKTKTAADRKRIGNTLQAHRKKEGLTRYAVSKMERSLSITQIKSIDESKKSYTVDSLLAYANTVGLKVELE